MYWILHVLELFHQVTMVTSADLIAEREWLSQSEILRTVSWKLKLSLRCFWEFAVQGLTILFFFFFFPETAKLLLQFSPRLCATNITVLEVQLLAKLVWFVVCFSGITPEYCSH